MASFRDPATYPALIQHFIYGRDRQLTYECIKDLPGINLDQEVILKAWEKAKFDEPVAGWFVASLAVSDGREDALTMLLCALNDSQLGSYRSRILRAIAKHSEAEESYDAIQEWYAKAKGNLVFDKAAKKFRMKPAAK